MAEMVNSQLLLHIYENERDKELDRAIQKFAWTLAGCKNGEPASVASCARMLKTLELLEADDPSSEEDLALLKAIITEAIDQAGKERIEAGSEHHVHDPESEKNLERYRRAGELLQADTTRPKAQSNPAGGKSKGHFRRGKWTRGFPKKLWAAIFFLAFLSVLVVLIVYGILYLAVRIGFGG
jgi:hypothetical protein